MAAYSDKRGRAGLPNPFRTYSNFVFPRTIKDVFIWATYLWERNAKYRTAIQKVVSYFISGINVNQDDKKNDVDTDAVNAFKDLLIDDYDILPLTLQFGEELAAMGNVFVSAESIFTRNLMCPTEGCAWQMSIKQLQKGRDYEWNGKEFVGVCPKCGKHVVWQIKDVKTQDAYGRKLRFVFRSAEDMRIQYNRLTGTFKYLYKLPSDVVDAIKRGDIAYLEDTPQVFLEAANNPDKLIKFPDRMFFSLRTRTLSQMDKWYKGWGLPLFMMAFDNVIRLQHLDKFNEAVILDYLVPTRIVSPLPGNLKAGIDDPNRMPMSGSAWSSMMRSAIKGKITNPTQWIISPVPVQETQVGGNKDVIPTELMEYEHSQFLSDTGIPQEFKQTTFQVVAPTMGLRMFEKQWIHFPKGMNKFIKWAADLIANEHSYEDMTCELDMTSFVEDDMNKQIMLNLMTTGVIAKTPILQKLGIDFEDDLKQRIKEQEMENDAAMEQQESQENREMTDSVMPPAAAPGIGQAQMNIDMMQQQAAGAQGMPAQPGQPAQPMAPMGAGGMMQPMPFNQGNSEAASIQQQFTEAQQMAEQLYAAPPNVRRQQLVQLKATNPSMHAYVNQILRDMEQQVASDAVAQSKQPQQ